MFGWLILGRGRLRTLWNAHVSTKPTSSIATEDHSAIDTLVSLIEDAIDGDRTDSLPAGLRDSRVVEWTARCAAVAVPEPDKSFPFTPPKKYDRK
ncbi:hypothetical protein EMGBD1_04200 [Anaerolineaceae bacterium]|nr:hypothetical protein EMGBD1_04200 [Anaerolineaceae bacterium]